MMRPILMAVSSTYASRGVIGSHPVSSTERLSRYHTVFGCTLSSRAVVSSELPDSRNADTVASRGFS